MQITTTKLLWRWVTCTSLLKRLQTKGFHSITCSIFMVCFSLSPKFLYASSLHFFLPFYSSQDIVNFFCFEKTHFWFLFTFFRVILEPHFSVFGITLESYNEIHTIFYTKKHFFNHNQKPIFFDSFDWWDEFKSWKWRTQTLILIYFLIFYLFMN